MLDRLKALILIQLTRWRAAFLQNGLTIPIGRGRVIVLRLLPLGAARSRLTLDLDLLAAGLTAAEHEVGFVQVGAFDGRANDPMHELIHRFGWRGVLVEPQPEVFARLRQTYADVDGLVFLNVAVADRSGEMTFWHIRGSEPDDPWWAAQISSFDRDHVLRHVIGKPELAARVEGIQVRTMTIEEVFAQAPRPVHVLQVDAEGYDAAIINAVDFKAHQPQVIRFEHRHLEPHEHVEAVRRLSDSGYRIAINEDDTLAMLHDRGRGATAIA
jgi:FkbM family methyltransferase